MSRAAIALLLLLGVTLAGPTGFASLKILPGAREAGMAGAGVASASGPAAIAWNPAAGAGGCGFSALASYTKWLLDTRQQALFVTRGFSPVSLTAGVVSFSAGEFEYRTAPTEQPIGIFTPTELTAYLGLARSFSSTVQLGLAGRYYYTRIMEWDGSGLGLDAGFRLRPLKGMSTGVSIVDFGKTITYQREVFWLPTRVRAGVSHTLGMGQTELTGAVDGSYFVYRRNGDARAGLELTWNQTLTLRAGCSFPAANPFSFGLGARAGWVRLDYAYAPLGFDLGSTHRFALTIGNLCVGRAESAAAPEATIRTSGDSRRSAPGDRRPNW